ncbi:MAG: glucose-6-phosphate isomerase family protein [Candidatus Anstonellales archaeon]
MIVYERPLRIEWDNDTIMVDGKFMKYEARKISEMNDVLYSFEAFSEDYPVYFMYRGIVVKSGIRYDLTLIPNKVFGEEFIKTYGHYHPIAENNLTYPEVYQVLYGEAIFLLQGKNRDGSVNVIKVRAKKGDVVLIPPNFGHVTINAYYTPLLLANLLADGFRAEYEEYRENHGAALYYTTGGWIPNGNYVVRGIKEYKPEEINEQFNFRSADLLNEFFATPEKFEFLKRPSLLIR